MPAFTKRLTANYSLKTQPTAASSAVFSDGLLGILRATRCKPAMLTQKRAQNELISANHGKKYLLHYVLFLDKFRLKLENTCRRNPVGI